MKNNEIKKFNLQFFADDGQGGTQPNGDGASSIDYESEYKKILAERDSYKAEAEKQKGLKDKYASENADYKKKELDKMTDDEKKAKEYQELIEAKNKMEAEIHAMKLEKELLSEGFTVEESEKLITTNFAVKTIAEIVKSKVDLAVKSAKAEGIKGTTPNSPLGNGIAKGDNKSDFQKYQETKTKTNNEVKLR